MMALTSVSMSVGGLNSVDCGGRSVATGLHWVAEGGRWRLASRLDSATRDVLNTGDGGCASDGVCSSGLQWIGEDVQLSNDNFTTVSRLSDSTAFDVAQLTAAVYNTQHFTPSICQRCILYTDSPVTGISFDGHYAHTALPFIFCIQLMLLAKK